jgi:hypothetical protein
MTRAAQAFGGARVWASVYRAVEILNASIDTVRRTWENAVSTITVGGAGNTPVATACIAIQIGQSSSAGAPGTSCPDPKEIAVLVALWLCSEGAAFTSWM